MKIFFSYVCCKYSILCKDIMWDTKGCGQFYINENFFSDIYICGNKPVQDSSIEGM